MKQETTSPTVSNESVFLTSVVDAHERRDVACYDIPGAFLHADSDGNEIRSDEDNSSWEEADTDEEAE